MEQMSGIAWGKSVSYKDGVPVGEFTHVLHPGLLHQRTTQPTSDVLVHDLSRRVLKRTDGR